LPEQQEKSFPAYNIKFHEKSFFFVVKIKILSGQNKRGKAYKTAMFFFLFDKATTNRESYIKELE
jgi:hypothetical protein